MHTPDFSSVTEVPGARASAEQLSSLYTRYHFAADLCRGKDVLEVACGAGLALKYLAQSARRVVAGDIEEKNLTFARELCAGVGNIELRVIDAQALPFPDHSFDVVLLYEAIYYLPQAKLFVREAKRVLRPNGILVICTVNKDWPGFNSSPFSTRYYSVVELARLLHDAQFHVEVHGAFPDDPSTLKRRLIAALRRLAVTLHLIPRTMKGKELLKRMFYGKLESLRGVEEGMAPLEPLQPLPLDRVNGLYKVVYAVGRS